VGLQGVSGPTGPAGPAGIASITRVESQHIRLAPGQSTVDVAGLGGFTADCPQGSYVVGTGFNGSVGHTSFVLGYTYFVGGFMHNDTSISYDVYIQAMCASGPGVSPNGKRLARQASDTQVFEQAVRNAQESAR
jgi:hypothetical protein